MASAPVASPTPLGPELLGVCVKFSRAFAEAGTVDVVVDVLGGYVRQDVPTCRTPAPPQARPAHRPALTKAETLTK
jgi:hypothetical protein